MQDYQQFSLGDFVLQSGEVLRQAKLAYATFGELNAQGDNAILIPSYYTGTHRSYLKLIGAGRALDPRRYFIVLTNMFGNGVSSSPSHDGAQHGADFPTVSIKDNVNAQHLLSMSLGINAFALVTGWSMGAMQAWQWAVSFPQQVKALLPVCGTARCWPLNHVFLEGIKGALQADPVYHHGRYRTSPLAGLAAFGRVYAGWAYSAEFFRAARYRDLGFETLEQLLQSWEKDHQNWDANNLLAMLATWQSGDVSLDAIAGVSAKTCVMVGSTDRYFTPEEARIEFDRLPANVGEWRPLVSPYGHCAGAPGRFARETAEIECAISELLRESCV
ncbi:alpha/beta fold hydrolase [Rouxiella badensis]|uniref:alpha/beta fold hydrolase n=1 Tax=Rouxiella badensis TaxID=1646377 RepID=UPI001B6BE819|nr:alpha/beta fold hydrolase [Rouxiella badensis]MCC3747303.1 alpha/beta fold hydrolase [Rouxiella badensis]